jgi:hypothetical protein
MHVAYNHGGSRNYPSISEAFIVAFRPRQNKHYYYGRNGNTDTVGIAYKNRYDKSSYPVWQCEWVRPAEIEMSWAAYAQTQEAARKRENNLRNQRNEAIANRRDRIAKIPANVLKAVGMDEYSTEDLINSGSTHILMTVDKLEAIIAAVKANSPDQIQREVEAALKLL